jgi:DNA polymerase III delta subunit
MKILHGENVTASRHRYLELKDQLLAQGYRISDLLGPELNLPQLTANLNSTSLFGEKNYVCIDQFFGRRAGKDKDTIIKFLKDNSAALILFWDDHDVSLQLKSIPPSLVERFELPAYIFKFVDTLTVSTFHQALTVSPPEQILALIIRQLHNLLLVKHQAGSLPDWQKSKLAKQASLFTIPSLVRAYQNLLTIDYRQKNSLSPFNLTTALEVWLVTLYDE